MHPCGRGLASCSPLERGRSPSLANGEWVNVMAICQDGRINGAWRDNVGANDATGLMLYIQ